MGLGDYVVRQANKVGRGVGGRVNKTVRGLGGEMSRMHRAVSPYAQGYQHIVTMPVRGIRDTTRALQRRTKSTRR